MAGALRGRAAVRKRLPDPTRPGGATRGVLSVGVEARQRPGAVAERLGRDAHPLGDREVEVAERPLAVVLEMPATGEQLDQLAAGAGLT